MRKSFSLIEIIFVFVIIGILAGVAAPKLFPTINTAKIDKLKSQISAIRVAINNAYSKNIISGNNKCPSLEKNINDETLFEGVLTYPISKNSGSIKWDGNGTDYNVTIDNLVVFFKYDNNATDNCKFECIDVNTTDGSVPEYNCSEF